MSDTLGRSTNMTWLKSLLAPRKFATVGPPKATSENTMIQKVEFNGNVLVNDTGLTFEQVKTNTGFVLWLVQRGIDAIQRFGFIPGGTNSQPGYGVRGFSSKYGSINGFSFYATIAVPYGQAAAADLIKYAPNLSENFSSARAIAGQLSMISDTVSTVSVPLTGTLSAAALSDTRDISQVQDGSFVTAYGAVAMSTQATTQFDGIIEERVDQGIVALIGPDYRADLRVPNVDVVTTSTGEIRPIATIAPSTTWNALTGANTRIRLARRLFTPWLISPLFDGADPTPTPDYGIESVPRLDEYGTLDFELVAKMTLQKSASTVNVDLVELRVCVEHYFINTSSNGSLQYTVGLEEVVIPITYPAAFTSTTEFNVPIRFSARPHRESLAKNGKYYCSNMTVLIQHTAAIGGSAVASTLTANVAISGDVIARGIDTSGNVGPARVIRWDGVGQGQTLRIEGAVYGEVVANSKIAVFTRGNSAAADQATNMNLVPLAQELFDSGIWQRVWRLPEYEQYLQNVLPSVSVEWLTNQINEVPLIGPKMAASGFFSSLGNIGKSILGGVKQGLDVAGQLAPYASLLAGAPMGAAGQFGGSRMGAAGQFGGQGFQSAGQFAASGMRRQRH